MNQWVCLVFLLFIRTSWQVHPRYTYVCKEDGSVQLTGFKTGSTVTIVNATNSSCITPTPETTTTDTDKHTITKECMGEDLSVKRTIEVTVQDINLGENQTPTPTPAKNLVGGLASHRFTLTCDPITNVDRTVLRQFHLNDLEKLYEKQNEIDQVDMRFKPDKNFNLPDISEAYTGDELYMFLQYKGVSDYKIVPQECIAYEGNDIKDQKANQQQLWAIEKNHLIRCLNAKANQYNLMGTEGFTYVDKKTVVARINAFHFQNKNDLTIFCRVIITSPSGNIPDDKNVCTPPITTPILTSTQATSPTTKRTSSVNSGRKKRAPSLEKHPVDVMKTLNIKDRMHAPGNRGTIVHFNGFFQVIVGVFGIVAVYVM